MFKVGDLVQVNGKNIMNQFVNAKGYISSINEIENYAFVDLLTEYVTNCSRIIGSQFPISCLEKIEY